MPITNLDTRTREVDRKLSNQHRQQLMDIPSVLGVGVGNRRVNGRYTGDCAIIVYVERKLPESELTEAEIVPDFVNCDGEHIPTDVKGIGTFVADSESGSPSRREAIEPIAGGLEIGSDGSSGTGTITGLFLTESEEPRLLTARHVVEDETGSADGIGNTVYQPASGDRFGEVIDSHPFYTEGTRRNQLDTAVIEPDDEDDVSGIYLGWREAVGTGRASVGDRVVAFSARSGIAAGEVTARAVQASIELSSGEIAPFIGLVEYDWGGGPGNSGAAVGNLDPHTRELTIVGQHIASSTSSSLMVPWVRIERRFGELFPADVEGEITLPDPEDDEDPEPPEDIPAEVYFEAEDESGNPLGDVLITATLDDDFDPDPAQVTFEVEDENGDPLEGVSIMANGQSTTTDSDGIAMLDLDQGEYLIEAERSGYEDTSTNISVSWGQTKTVPLELASEGVEQAEVTIIVEDEGGDPITTASVDVNGTSESVDSAGEAFFELDEGTYTAEASASGYTDESTSFSVNWGDERTETLTLEETDTVSWVDNFNRTSLGPNWTAENDNASIQYEALYAGENSQVHSQSGLDNYPVAGNEFEYIIRFESSGGTSDNFRVLFGMAGSNFADNAYRMEFNAQSGNMNMARADGGGSTGFGTFIGSGPTTVGEAVGVRVDWQTGGTFGISLHDADWDAQTIGAEREFQELTDDVGGYRSSGGVGAWTNFSTEFSLDSWRIGFSD